MWKDIKNYEGLYQVSTEGKIRSLDRIVINIRKRFFKGKVLKCNVGTNGYYYVILSKNGVTKTKYIHKLVAETFLTNTENLSDVDHINGNKLDNHLCNLRYLSHFENSSRANKGINRTDKSLEKNGRAKSVIGIKDGKIIERYDCAKKISIKYSINYSTLKRQLQHNCCIINQINYYYDTKNR